MRHCYFIYQSILICRKSIKGGIIPYFSFQYCLTCGRWLLQYCLDQKYGEALFPYWTVLSATGAGIACRWNRWREDHSVPVTEHGSRCQITYFKLSSVHRNIWFYRGMLLHTVFFHQAVFSFLLQMPHNTLLMIFFIYNVDRVFIQFVRGLE